MTDSGCAPRMKASGATSIALRSNCLLGFVEPHQVVKCISKEAANKDRLSAPYPRARNPGARRLRPPGRTSTIRATIPRSSASTALATARYVFPVPAGPIENVMSCVCICWRYSIWRGVLPRKSLRRVISASSGRVRLRSILDRGYASSR